jgi:hypothetical protein
MPTSISSQFTIVSTDTVAAGQTLTITNPGRTLQVIAVRAKGAGNAVYTLSKAEPGGNPTQFAAGAISDSPLEGWVDGNVTLASSSLTATEELRLVVSGASITAVCFDCIGSPSQALTSAVA